MGLGCLATVAASDLGDLANLLEAKSRTRGPVPGFGRQFDGLEDLFLVSASASCGSFVSPLSSNSGGHSFDMPAP